MRYDRIIYTNGIINRGKKLFWCLKFSHTPKHSFKSRLSWNAIIINAHHVSSTFIADSAGRPGLQGAYGKVYGIHALFKNRYEPSLHTIYPLIGHG